MSTGQIVIAIVLGVLSNVISFIMIEIVKWQLRGLTVASAKERLTFWFYSHVESILLAGISIDLIFLAAVLIKFPTVTVWTVLVIVLSVAVMSFQIGLYMFIKLIKGILDWMLKGLKKWGQHQGENPSST
jgi:hypothetical protein